MAIRDENILTIIDEIFEKYLGHIGQAIEVMPHPYFSLFSYPGGLGFEVKADGKLHKIKEGNDRGGMSTRGAAEWYYNLLIFYELKGQTLTKENVEAKLQKDIGARVDTLTQEAEDRIRREDLPERLRTEM